MVCSGEVKTVFKCLKFLVSLIIVTSASIKHTNNVTETFPITRYYFWSKTDAALVLKRRMSGWIYLCLKGNKTPGALAEALSLEASLGQWQVTSVTTLSSSAQQVRTAL